MQAGERGSETSLGKVAGSTADMLAGGGGGGGSCTDVKLGKSAMPKSGDDVVDNLFRSAVGQLREIMIADRATLFLVDEETQELWSKASAGAGRVVAFSGHPREAHPLSHHSLPSSAECGVERRGWTDI